MLHLPESGAMRIALCSIHERVFERPEGYLEDVLSRGQIIGQELELSDADYQALLARYSDFPIPRFTIAEKGARFVGSIGRWIAAGLPVVSKAAFERRLAICQGCQAWAGTHCTVCGCGTIKHELATERCPLGKWLATDVQNG